MSIRTKIVGAICLVFLLAMAVFYFASNSLILKQFKVIENENAITDNNSAVKALNNQIEQLRLKGVDWAYWDDTYKFINDHNQAFATSNVQLSSLEDLHINLMLFYNLKGNLVLSKGVDLATSKVIPIPTDITNNFKIGSPLFKMASDTDQNESKGLLKTTTDPLIVVALPILPTGGQGPAHGTLVFGQYLDVEAIDKLKALTNLNLNFENINSLPNSTNASSLADNQTVVQPVSSTQINSYSAVNDVFGQPLLLASVVDSRDIYQQGRHSVTVFMATIGFVSLASLIIALYIANQLIQKDQVIRLKNEFFSIASHELRTPLTAIRGNSSMLLDLDAGKLEPNQAEMVQSIYQASTGLIKVVNHFLDAARLEQGIIKLYPSTFSLNEVVQAVVSELGPLTHQRGLDITVEGFDDLPPVFADRERVREIIYNLVGNSIKYTERGGVTITAKQAGSNIEVYVVDTGIGMTDAEKQKLFTRFQTGQYGGVGLGLYISKMLAQKMDGQMTLVESKPGRGTTFMFCLPIASQKTVHVTEAATISELSHAAAIGEVKPPVIESSGVEPPGPAMTGETVYPGKNP